MAYKLIKARYFWYGWILGVTPLGNDLLYIWQQDPKHP